MSQVLTDLLELLSLEKIEHGIYRGQSQDLVLKRYLVARSWDRHCLRRKIL